jgi:hypothetical protein
MKIIINGLRIIAGAVIFATALTLLLSLPGFVSDRDSTVPISVPQATRR